MSGKVILFMNARDEENLKEWVAHHLLLGFDLIYIFDHKSKVPLKGQFTEFNKDYQRVFVSRCELDGAVKDILITKASKIAQKMNADWFLYLDADEFLVINDDNITNVKQLLKCYPQADSLSCNWLVFGTNYHVKEPEGLIIDNYTRSERQLNEHLKTFIRPREFLSPNAHRSLVRNPDKAFHFNGKCLNRIFPIYKENKHYINPIDFREAKIFIAHYFYQSKEKYFRRKLSLPRDDNGQPRNPEELSFNLSTINSHSNETINTLVKDKYSNKIKDVLNNL
jgi:hypothetical protein